MEALAAELLGALRDDASGAPAAASARAAPSLTAPRVAQAAPLQPVQLITSAEQAEAEAAAALPPRALPLPPAAVLTAAEAPARLAQQYLLDTRGLRIHSLAAVSESSV